MIEKMENHITLRVLSFYRFPGENGLISGYSRRRVSGRNATLPARAASMRARPSALSRGRRRRNGRWLEAWLAKKKPAVVGVGKQGSQFAQQPVRPEQAEASLPGPVVQGGSRHEHQGQGSGLVRGQGGKRQAGGFGVAVRALGTGQAQQHRDRDLEPGRLGPTAAGHDGGGVLGLVHGGKRRLVAGFEPDVDHGQAVPTQGFECGVGFAGQAAARGVAGHPGDPGQPVPDGVKQPAQPVHRHGQHVAVAQKHPALAPAVDSGEIEVRGEAGFVAQAVGLVAVGAAEGAGVVGAAVGGLDEDAVRLAGRADHGADVFHADLVAQTGRRGEAPAGRLAAARGGGAPLLAAGGVFPRPASGPNWRCRSPNARSGNRPGRRGRPGTWPRTGGTARRTVPAFPGWRRPGWPACGA